MNTTRSDIATMSLVGLAHAGSHFSQMMLAPLFPVFMSEFNLNFSQIGFLVTVLFVTSSLGQASSGFAVDRFGARPVLFLSFSLFLAAALLTAHASSYFDLIAVMVLLGVGNAPFHPADFTIMNQRVSEARLGYAYSVHGVTGNLGWALAPIFFVGIASLSHWRTAYLCAAGLYLVILLILYVNKAKISTTVVAVTNKVQGEQAASHFDFLRLPVVWWCFSFFAFSTMTLAVIQSFSVSILDKLHGITLVEANTVLTAYMLCAATGMVAGGWIAAKFAPSSDRIVAHAMTAAAVLLMLAATGWLGGLGTSVLIASTGFAIGVAGPSRDMMIKKATPQGATGRVYGLVYSGMDLGFAIAPIVFGLMMDRGWYAATLVGAGVTLLIAVALALGVGRRSS